MTAGEVLVHLRAAATQYGEARLGLLASRIRTHSLRAGAAIAMFLAACRNTCTILKYTTQNGLYCNYEQNDIFKLNFVLNTVIFH
jgi:hypothetical protein